jgi:hypothetical protein
MKPMANLLFISLVYLVAASSAGVAAAQRITLSLDQAVEVIRKGIGSPGVSDREALEASYTVVVTAKRNPELVKPFKELLVKEITRLDAWKYYTEASGGYKLDLISALFPLADPKLVPFFIRQCQHGSFVKEGLAKVGRVAIPPLIDELLDGRHTTCAAMSLAAIGKEGLGPASQLPPEEKKLLRRNLQELAVPALERALELARQEKRADPGPGARRFSMPRISEGLEEIRQLLSQ